MAISTKTAQANLLARVELRDSASRNYVFASDVKLVYKRVKSVIIDVTYLRTIIGTVKYETGGINCTFNYYVRGSITRSITH